MIAFFAVSQTEKFPQVFRFVAQSNAVRSVNVAGTFNNWAKDGDPMKLGADGKTWSTKILLPYGRIQYKFVVNGNDWVLDPAASAVPDGTGHTNSEILVLPPDFVRAATRTDGITAKSALLHIPREPQLNYDRGQLQIEFRARADDLASVTLEHDGRRQPMSLVAHDDLYDYYQTKLPWNRKSDVHYEFRLVDGNAVAFYGEDGYGPEKRQEFVLAAKTYKPFVVPDWTPGKVLYQIFPDRFANGDTKNDPRDVQPWTGKPTYSNRFGGDAAGVQDHIDYLKKLGVAGVYFNPLFESPSNHRYDATDYEKIDPEFGTNGEFDTLTQNLKRAGIRTILDFAFNHSSVDFLPFADIRKNGPKSSYLDWYFIKSFPVTVHENPPYVAWFNFPSLPKLNVVNPPTEKYLLGVVDYWRTHAGIEGARLDAANEVDSKLWRDLRTHVKAEDPGFWIVGEEWGNATQWLEGDQWDSTMGYEFRDACLAYFADRRITAEEFLNRLMKVYQEYPPQVSRNLMNLIGSHDTARFLTLCNQDVSRLKLAATVQLTWPGTPSIYYGDEIGMEGGPDPDDRRPMDWGRALDSNDLLRFYKSLINARNHSLALQLGEPKVVFTNNANNVLVYTRTHEKDAAVVAVNSSDRPQDVKIPVPADHAFDRLRIAAIDVITGKRFSTVPILSFTLPPKGAAVLLPSGDLDTTRSDLGASGPRTTIFSGHRSPISSQGAISK